MAKDRPHGLMVEVNGDISGLKGELKKAKLEILQTESSIREVNKRIKLDPKHADDYVIKQKLLNQAIEDTNKQLARLKGIKDSIDNKGGNKLSKEYQQLLTEIRNAENALKKYKEQITDVSPRLQVLRATTEQYAKSLDKMANKVKGLSAFSSIAIASSVAMAVAYEENIAKIKKVAKDLSSNEIEDLKNLSVDKGQLFGEVSDYAEMGSVFGIATKNLADFASTMIDVKVATDNAISGQEGAKSFVRFLNVMGHGVEDAQKFGSALTYVSDNYSATADEILHSSLRLSGLKNLDLGVSDIIGLSAIMKNVGLVEESATSAVNKTFLQLKKAASTGNKLEDIAKIAGTTGKAFQKLMSNNAMEAFLRFIDGLNATQFNNINKAVKEGTEDLNDYAQVLHMSSEEFKKAWGKDNKKVFEDFKQSFSQLGEDDDIVTRLSDVSMAGVRQASTLMRLAGQGNEIKKAIGQSNKAWKENTALAEKANTMYETTKYQLTGLTEELKQSGESMARSFLPALKGIVRVGKNVLNTFEHLPSPIRDSVAGFLALGASSYPVLKGMSNIHHDVADVIKALEKASGKGNKAASVALSFGKNIAAASPYVLALTGALAVLYAGYRKYKDAFTFDKQIEQLKGLTNNFENLKQNTAKSLTLEVAMLNKDFSREKYNEVATSVETLAEAYRNTADGSEEQTNALTQLNKVIDKYNQLTGLSIEYANGAFVDENGKVINLKESYDKLYEAKKKAIYQDVLADKTKELIQQQLESEKILADAQEDYTNVVSRLNAQQVVQLRDLVNSNGGGVALTYADNVVKTAWNKLLGLRELRETNKDLETEITNLQETFKKITNPDVSTEESTNLIKQALFDPLDNFKKEMETFDTKELEKKLGFWKEMLEVDPSNLDVYQERIKLIEELIKQKNEDQKNYEDAVNEFSEANHEDELNKIQERKDTRLSAEDELLKNGMVTLDTLGTHGDKIFDRWLLKASNVMRTFSQVKSSISPLNGVGTPPRYARRGISSFVADENTILNGDRGMFISIPSIPDEDIISYGNAINHAARSARDLSQYTYNNDVKVDFHVQTTQSITENDIRRFGNLIVDVVDEGLGRRF